MVEEARRNGTDVTMTPGRDRWWHELPDEPQAPPEPMDANEPLAIIYTSGTSGKPKGIVHSHGGFLVKVEVYKFLEDMIKPDRQAAGRAVFNNDFPVNRTREIVGPVPAPVGWIQRGRDLDLEQAILAGIRDALFL